VHLKSIIKSTTLGMIRIGLLFCQSWKPLKEFYQKKVVA